MTTIVKSFEYTQENKTIKSVVQIERRETPETETGLTWVVRTQINNHEPIETGYERYTVAEMAFKNFVLDSLNSDLHYQYSASK